TIVVESDMGALAILIPERERLVADEEARAPGERVSRALRLRNRRARHARRQGDRDHGDNCRSEPRFCHVGLLAGGRSFLTGFQFDHSGAKRFDARQMGDRRTWSRLTCLKACPGACAYQGNTCRCPKGVSMSLMQTSAGTAPTATGADLSQLLHLRDSAGVPHYLNTHYWWAYVHPRAVGVFERQWLVNFILWGNYSRLRDAALAELGERLPGRTLQVACAYGNLTARLSACVAAGGGVLDVI